MVGLPKFYPTNSLLASFGRSMNEDNEMKGAADVLVKEFRFWNR